MSECLHCGGCCKTMSPKSAPFHCPDLIKIERYYFCRNYENSPAMCQRFTFEEFRYCPYGLNELQLSDPEDREILEQRVKDGRRIIAAIQQRREQKKKLKEETAEDAEEERQELGFAKDRV